MKLCPAAFVFLLGVWATTAMARDEKSDGKPPSGSGAPNWVPAASEPQGAIRAVTGIRLLERGAVLADDFEGRQMDDRHWRLWQMDPAKTVVEQKGGRLELTVTGSVAHNGVTSQPTVKYKDVVLVAEMDIRSQGAEPHHLALHLCGGDSTRSPDHWTEVNVIDLGDMARLATLTARPETTDNRQAEQTLVLPHPPGKGFLCRIELNGSTNLAALSVKTPEGWRPIADPIDLNLRTIHTELKVDGYDVAPGGPRPETVSRAWFDNVRIYPRPQSHSVGVRLVTPAGEPIWRRPNDGWPPIFTDASGRTRRIDELTVQLLTADGSRVVASSQSKNMGFYLLPLKDAPWDVYPVSAQIRVLLDGKPLGDPARIEVREGRATEGLYPDDVYNVVME